MVIDGCAAARLQILAGSELTVDDDPRNRRAQRCDGIDGLSGLERRHLRFRLAEDLQAVA